MKKFLLRIGLWISLRLHLYYWWSRLYQWIYENRKWKQVRIPLFETFEEIEEVTGKLGWTADGWKELRDAISSPQAAYGKYLEGNSAGDCDDTSSVAVFCLERARFQGKLSKRITEVGLLTVPWINADDSVGGHNVCAFCYENETKQPRWGYISNWYSGKIRYGFDSKVAVARHMVSVSKSTPLSWAYAKAHLTIQNDEWDKARLHLQPSAYQWALKGEP